MSANAPALLVFPPWAPGMEYPECGLAYLKSELQRRGHVATLLDLNIDFLARRPDARRIADYCHRAGPYRGALRPPSLRLSDVAQYVEAGAGPWDADIVPSLLDRLPPGAPIVGFSIVSTTQLPPALILARRVREARPEARILLGGPWCTAAFELLPQVLQRFAFVDGAVPYDGEAPLAALLAAAPGVALDALPGFVTADATLASGLLPPVPMHQLPPPDYTDLPLDRYSYATLPLRTRRGCCWGQCVFCVELHPGDRQSSAPMPAALAVDHMSRLFRETGLADITLANHVTPPDELDALARAIRDRGSKVRWSSLCRFDEALTHTLLQSIAAAGCRRLAFGLESVHQPDLTILRKGIDLDAAMQNLADCHAAGIRVEVTVMAFPGQTKGGFADTLDFLLQHPNLIHAVTPTRYALMRPSVAYREPERLGLTPTHEDDDLDVFNLPYAAADMLSVDEFRHTVDEFERRWRDCKGDNKTESPSTA